MYGLLRVCDIIFHDLIDVAEEVISVLDRTVTVMGTDYTILDLMFGIGLPVVLFLSVVKWVIGIIT